MGFRCGIVGLPNVGKSTIFNALTAAGAQAGNFPFCTIEPNQGIVEVPDPRLQEIAERIPPEKIVPTSMTFVDIAGLVAGASQGEGLGNKFLAHIRETNAIAHVVRCFVDDDVIHVDGTVDPIRDIEVIETELVLADLETVLKREQALGRKARSGDKQTLVQLEVIGRVREVLDEGKPIRSMKLNDRDRLQIRDLCLITEKPMMFVANVMESDIGSELDNPMVKTVIEYAASVGASVVPICGKIEAELLELEGEERDEFLSDLGLTEPGLNRVIRAGYELLALQTYFTAGEKEVRAWTFPAGSTAPEAAGVIHSDFERGFIKADVYHYDDLLEHGSEAAVKSAGVMRLEGKEYIVQDGDVMHFRFAV